MFGVVTVSGKK